LVCIILGWNSLCASGDRILLGSITGFLEDSPVLLGFSLLAFRVLLFMQKFRDFLCTQSTDIAKQNKQQRLSSNVHNTHTTQEERSW